MTVATPTTELGEQRLVSITSAKKFAIVHCGDGVRVTDQPGWQTGSSGPWAARPAGARLLAVLVERQRRGELEGMGARLRRRGAVLVERRQFIARHAEPRRFAADRDRKRSRDLRGSAAFDARLDRTARSPCRAALRTLTLIVTAICS